MINAYPVDQVLGDELAQPGVGGRIDLRVLLAQTREFVDGEEPAISDQPAVPGHQAVVLPVVHVGRCAAEGPGGDGEVVLEVAQLVVVDLQRREVAVGGEDREGDRAVGAVAGREVDVEVGAVVRVPPVAQDIGEPRIGHGVGDPGVIGDDVDDQADVDSVRRPPQLPQSVEAAEGRCDLRRRQPVVAVGGARRRATDRGQVEVADTQLAQMPQNACGVGESEPGVQLHAVGGARLATIGHRLRRPYAGRVMIVRRSRRSPRRPRSRCRTRRSGGRWTARLPIPVPGGRWASGSRCPRSGR